MTRPDKERDQEPNGGATVSGNTALKPNTAISLPARIAGMVRAPKTTLHAVAATPTWAGVLLTTTLVTFAANAALLQTEVGRLALVDQWERTAIAFGGAVDDAQYARFQELSHQGVGYAAITAIASGPVLTLGLALLLLLVLRSLLKTKATFQQVLGIVAHAGVILALRQLIAAPLDYAFETLASPTTLVRFAGSVDESSPVARFLGAIDVFVIWWVVVLAIGTAVLARRTTRPLALAFAGAYVALAVLLAIAMADRKSTRLNSSHVSESRMPSSA